MTNGGIASPCNSLASSGQSNGTSIVLSSLAQQTGREDTVAQDIHLQSTENPVEVLEPRRQITELQKKIDTQKKHIEDMRHDLSNLAHDLKSPLTGVLGALSLLQLEFAELPERTTADLQEIVEILVRQSQLFVHMIDTLKLLAHVGSTETLVTSVAAYEAATAAQSQISMHISGASATVKIEKNLPNVLGNFGALVRIFQNLISNAIKYHHPGMNPIVSISCAMIKEDGQDLCQFSVEDNGVGISEEHREEIFQPFHRLKVTQKVDGTGLGLASTKRLVEKLDGTIWVDAAPDRGSIFRFTLPLPEEPIDSTDTHLSVARLPKHSY